MARLKEIGETKIIELSDAKHSVHMISLGIFLSAQFHTCKDMDLRRLSAALKGLKAFKY